MKKPLLSFPTGAVACAALVALLGAGSAQAAPAGVQAELQGLLGTARRSAKARANLNANAVAEESRLGAAPDGHVRFLGSAPEHQFPLDAADIVPGNPEATAQKFLKRHGKIFGANSAAVDFQHAKTKAKNARRFVRFQQTYGGVPVFGAQVNVQLNDENGVESVLSDIQRDTSLLDTKALTTTPTVTARAATDAARAALLATAPGAQLTFSEPVLMLFAPEVIGNVGPVRLTWMLTALSEIDHDVDDQMFVDAHTGAIVKKIRLSCTALNRRIYDANSTTSDPGTLVRSEGGAAAALAEANAAYNFLGDTYNFYVNNHGRDSIDGMGLTLSATVRVCTSADCPWRNAQYRSNNRMYFGIGYVDDDATAHELTHGVTRFESGLIYQDASGAINESFSDIWGEFVDLGNGAGTDTAGVRWDIGEDLPIGRIRSMSDPTIFNHPDRLGSPNYYTGTADDGGVHSNSGVNNKLAYLLTDGDTFNGQTVYGLGVGRVADLYYEVQTDLLTSGADWTDLYQALRQAAVNLSWSTDDRNNLYRACVAVEIATGGRNIYVDGTSGCLFQTGAQNCTITTGPFHAVATGNGAVAPGDNLYIRGDSYNEAVTFSKIMTIRSYSGAATIGQ